MERLNCINQQFSKEKNGSRNVCVNSADRIVQEICSDRCNKISNSHDLSSDNLNKTVKQVECVPAYQCDKPGGYVFVDVGSDLIESGYLLEEDDDICQVSSETVFTDGIDLDYNLVKNVNIERCLKNSSKDNEMNNHNLETTVFNVTDIYTGNVMSGLSTNACMENMCENLNEYDKKSSIDIDYTTTSTVVSVSGGFKKVNTYEKKEKSVEDVLVHQSTENTSPEIKKEDMVYDEEVLLLNESIIDTKLHPVNKVEEPPGISTNYSCVLDKNSKTGFIVLSETVTSDVQEVHTECSKKVPATSDISDVMVLKPLKENETVQSKRESHLELQNKVQTLSRTCSGLQIKPQTNSGDDIGADGVAECTKKLSEKDVNTEAKNKNDEICEHHRNRKSKHTTDTRYVYKVCCKHLKARKCTHTGDRPFGCSIYDKTFKNNSSLENHKRIHSGDRPFSCICGEAFKNKSALERHKRILSGARHFGCSTCGKAFTNLANLKHHKHIHMGDRPFGCSTCGKAFTQLAHLKCHRRIHSDDRPFGCDTCDKAFKDSSSCKAHKHVHTSDRPFDCSTCGKAFTQRVVMKFLVNEGVKPGDIYRRLLAQYGDETLSRSKTFEWCKRFKEGRTSVSDNPGRGGSEPTVITPMNIQRVEELILDNRQITCQEIAEKIYVSVGTVNTIIHKHLKFNKVSACWVPQGLNR